MNKVDQYNNINQNIYYLKYMLERLAELREVNTAANASLLRKFTLWFAYGRKYAIEKNILWVINEHTDLITNMINTYIDILYDNMKSI